ncbi:hypothetical protein [Agrobacterium sp. lyk4-40-TYG-31]|uniref:hypothetical protein n=1 Tax=Agrobacterium sp. lyk4-40-TYG-31 TaxID=3040276 RepID=UPI0025503C26|nr:hypothetical protein [Agrobacterium sp. lyk4-40-TYG-31]
MPEVKSQLLQSILKEQKRRGVKDRAVYEELGVPQQTFSTWKRGAVPRPVIYPKIAAFLGIPETEVADMAREASQAESPNKISGFVAARVYGSMSDRKDGKWKFQPINDGRKRIPEGRYAIVIDTKIMEPIFHVGVKAWLDPSRWPSPGDDVMAHSGGYAWIGRFESMSNGGVQLARYNGAPVEVKNVEAIHVIILSERVVTA